MGISGTMCTIKCAHVVDCSIRVSQTFREQFTNFQQFALGGSKQQSFQLIWP